MTRANGFDFSIFDIKIDSQLFIYIDLEKQQHEGPGG